MRARDGTDAGGVVDTRIVRSRMDWSVREFRAGRGGAERRAGRVARVCTPLGTAHQPRLPGACLRDTADGNRQPVFCGARAGVQTAGRIYRDTRWKARIVRSDGFAVMDGVG